MILNPRIYASLTTSCRFMFPTKYSFLASNLEGASFFPQMVSQTTQTKFVFQNTRIFYSSVCLLALAVVKYRYTGIRSSLSAFVVPSLFFHPSLLRDTFIKTGDEKNYVWTKVAPNPSRIHKTTKNMILCKNLMFIFSLILSFYRYCRSKKLKK